jgi:hypothetical protein
MKFSFKAFLVLAITFFFAFDGITIQDAQAGQLVRRRLTSRYRLKVRRSTVALRGTSGRIGGGKNFGTEKSITNVYKARVKEYKIALKMWQKEKKEVEKLQKEYAKLRAKQQKQEAKDRLEMAKRLAKQRERQQIAIAEAREEGVTHEAEKSSTKDTKKSQSIFSKLTNKGEATNSAPPAKKTLFKKDKLKFMSKLFLSLFGRD